MYILLLASPTPRLYHVAFLTPCVAPSSPVATVASAHQLISSPLCYMSNRCPHTLPSPPLVQSHALRLLNVRRMLVHFIFLFSFSFTDSLSLTCIPSCLLCHHALTLSRSPSPCICHTPPLCLSHAATSPHTAPCHVSRFGPMVNGGDSVVGRWAGWSASAGVEFKGPVLGTAKRPETGLDRTGKDWTAVASCII